MGKRKGEELGREKEEVGWYRKGLRLGLFPESKRKNEAKKFVAEMSGGDLGEIPKVNGQRRLH
jgi:hypothetical protein